MCPSSRDRAAAGAEGPSPLRPADEGEHNSKMSLPADSTSTPAAPAGRRSLRAAWISVALIPVAFVAAFVLGEWLYSVQGYETGGDGTAPIEVVLLAGIPAVLIMIAPGVAAGWLGLRARRQGIPGGLIPAVIGILAAAFGLLTNALPLLLSAG